MESGLENTEAQPIVEDVKPAEDVKTEAEETEATSQAKEEITEELYVDDEEGDQKKPNMSQEAAYAAFRKEQKKRKEKQKQIDAEKEESERLRKELEELKSTVGKIAKGAPPTLESCDYDEEAFRKKVLEYYSDAKPEAGKPAANTEQEKKANDEAQFYLYQKEQDIKKVMPGYDKSKDAFVGILKDHGIDRTEDAIEFLADIARHKGADIAKVIVAVENRPSIIGDIQRAGNNQILIADILQEAANKVKTRSKKAIDSQPEPEISNTGPIDYSSAQVEKLRQAWVENSNTRTYAAYKAAKDKLKTKGK